jgi:hypothetical protein
MYLIHDIIMNSHNTIVPLVQNYLSENLYQFNKKGTFRNYLPSIYYSTNYLILKNKNAGTITKKNFRFILD